MTAWFPLSHRLRTLVRRGAIGAAAVVLVALCTVAGLIASRDYASIERQVIARIEQETGAKLTFEGRRQILWPKPKIVLDTVTFARPEQVFSLKAEQAVLNFELLDLIDGTIDGPAITLVKPEISALVGPLDAPIRSPRAITDFLARMTGLFDNRLGLSRLRVNLVQATLVLRRSTTAGDAVTLTNLDTRLRFSASRGRIDITGKQNSTVRPLEFSASLPTLKTISADKNHAASIHVSGFNSRLSFTGVARREPDIALVGRLDVTTGAEFEQAVLALPADGRERKAEAARTETSTLTAAMTLDPRGIGLETLRITRGAKQLSGIAALREMNGRWGVSATLAGDLVDGSAAHAALQGLRSPDGAWSSRPLAINPLPGVDLDIRLSTRDFKLGNLVLTNVALSILTRFGRTEMAIVDSRFGEGIIKARVSLSDAADGNQDLRMQASGERVEMGRLLERAFGFNRLTGDGSLVVQAEGRGGSVASIVAALSGTGAVDVRAGEIVGIDLQRLLARSAEPRAEAALLFSLAGKTAFEAFRINFAIKDGRIEPVGSAFTSPRVNAMLEGGIDLPAQRHQLAIVLKRRIEEVGLPGEFYAFRLDGPLLSPNLKPDLKLLQNRN